MARHRLVLTVFVAAWCCKGMAMPVSLDEDRSRPELHFIEDTAREAAPAVSGVSPPERPQVEPKAIAAPAPPRTSGAEQSASPKALTLRLEDDMRMTPPVLVTAPSNRYTDAADDSALNLLDAMLAPLNETEQAELRRAGRSVQALANETVTWLRPAIDGVHSMALSSDLSALLTELPGPLAADAHFNSGTTRSALQAGGAYRRVANLDDLQGPGDSRVRRSVDDAERDVIRDALRNLRTLLDHPMSWFVLSLLAIALVGSSLAKRWLR